MVEASLSFDKTNESILNMEFNNEIEKTVMRINGTSYLACFILIISSLMAQIKVDELSKKLSFCSHDQKQNILHDDFDILYSRLIRSKAKSSFDCLINKVQIKVSQFGFQIVPSTKGVFDFNLRFFHNHDLVNSKQETTHYSISKIYDQSGRKHKPYLFYQSSDKQSNVSLLNNPKKHFYTGQGYWKMQFFHTMVMNGDYDDCLKNNSYFARKLYKAGLSPPQELSQI